MIRSPRLPLLLATLVAVSACAGAQEEGGALAPPLYAMDRGTCGNANWFEVGRAEGRRGAPAAEVLSGYYGFCEKHGEAPDDDWFMEGYAHGRAERGAGG